jgi:hypothetical protein
MNPANQRAKFAAKFAGSIPGPRGDTMAAGALATLFSLVSPIAFLVILPRTESGLLLAVSIANTAATMSAQIYIR